MAGKKESIHTSTRIMVSITAIFILGYLASQSEVVAGTLSVIVIFLIIAIPTWLLLGAISRAMNKNYDNEEEKIKNGKSVREENFVSKKNMEKLHQTYTTSRLSSKNVLFPSTITLTDFGVIIRDPVFYAGRETTTPYSKISTVKVKRPLIGFSDVILDIMGADQLKIHGFTADVAEEIKSVILDRLK